MKNLEKVDLSSHKIHEISPEINNLLFLGELDLSPNLLSKLPDNFAFLKNLCSLNLSQN